MTNVISRHTRKYSILYWSAKEILRRTHLSLGSSETTRAIYGYCTGDWRRVQNCTTTINVEMNNIFLSIYCCTIQTFIGIYLVLQVKGSSMDSGIMRSSILYYIWARLPSVPTYRLTTSKKSAEKFNHEF